MLKRLLFPVISLPDWVFMFLDLASVISYFGLGAFGGILATSQNPELVNEVGKLGQFPFYFWLSVLLLQAFTKPTPKSKESTDGRNS